MLGIYYLFKKYETPESIEKEERTKQKVENKYKRRLCECKICTEIERCIVKRDYERLEIGRVSYSSLPYNEKLRDDKLYPKKKTSQYISKQNIAMRLAFAKEHIS
ncbi:hypothetical protein AVEN_254702-1 [Araneus ventricosus]|uniref:Uncharacterized protein n=1 Tax=Araneus ventricosus TaxID=182803 RepID=A0A4Y2K5C5_ARAVE|nr:hypothetical protein AVEN_254702-1 [Araneus ventricosus]